MRTDAAEHVELLGDGLVEVRVGPGLARPEGPAVEAEPAPGLVAGREVLAGDAVGGAGVGLAAGPVRPCADLAGGALVGLRRVGPVQRPAHDVTCCGVGGRVARSITSASSRVSSAEHADHASGEHRLAQDGAPLLGRDLAEVAEVDLVVLAGHRRSCVGDELVVQPRQDARPRRRTTRRGASARTGPPTAPPAVRRRAGAGGSCRDPPARRRPRTGVRRSSPAS